MSWVDHEDDEPTDEVLTPLGAAREAARLGFEALMRRLEALEPATRVLGSRALPADEPLRFRQKVDASFSYADVVGVQIESVPESDARPSRDIFSITTSFLGMLGVGSPLPSGMLGALREAADDEATAPFFEVFHHRLMSLFYRALLEGDLGRWTTGDAHGWVARLANLAGVRIDAITISVFGSQELMAMVPFLAPMHRRSNWALQGVLRTVLSDLISTGGDIDIDPLLESWADLDLEDQCRLGRDNRRLGRAPDSGLMVLGTRMRVRNAHVGVRIGPMTYESYARLQHPDGLEQQRLRMALKLMGHDGVRYRITVCLAPGQVPEIALGRSGRLGRDAWLAGRSGRLTDVVLALESI